jgi:predicted ATPase
MRRPTPRRSPAGCSRTTRSTKTPRSRCSQALRALGRVDEQRAAYRAYALRLEEELGVEPSHRVRRLLPDGATAKPAPAAGPPAQPAPAAGGLIGREQALDELTGLLQLDACRMVTLSGPGGVGKSSLAKQALRHVQASFIDGAHWIALDDLHDTTQVAARLAVELRLPPGGPQPPLVQVAEHLAEREALLVFDNAEHLAELPRLLERLLERAPRLRVCATSRVRLGVRGERVLPLAGLALPAPAADVEAVLGSAAAQLFVSAARAVRPDFDAASQARAIGSLVRATGGLPLAILLAANWVRLLPVAEIDAELARSVDVLEAADEGEERPEHRSVRATFERSWQLLTAREQRALAVLSVFAGSFSRTAAHQVAAAALPLLAALADKSLLQLERGDRCALHPLIRQLAGETLDAEARAAAQAQHARHFHRRLAQLSAAAQAADQSALDEIGVDLENFRLAWRWAIAERDAEAIAGSTSALKEYFNVRGRVAEGLALLAEARTAARRVRARLRGGPAGGDRADALPPVAARRGREQRAPRPAPGAAGRPSRRAGALRQRARHLLLAAGTPRRGATAAAAGGAAGESRAATAAAPGWRRTTFPWWRRRSATTIALPS